MVKRKDEPSLQLWSLGLDQMRKWSECLDKNERSRSMLRRVPAKLDGTRIPYAEYIDGNLQNTYYEGWAGSVRLTNLLEWNFFEELVHVTINFPCSCYDLNFSLALGLSILNLSEQWTLPVFAILYDSSIFRGFPHGYGKIIRDWKSKAPREFRSENNSLQWTWFFSKLRNRHINPQSGNWELWRRYLGAFRSHYC